MHKTKETGTVFIQSTNLKISRWTVLLQEYMNNISIHYILSPAKYMRKLPSSDKNKPGNFNSTENERAGPLYESAQRIWQRKLARSLLLRYLLARQSFLSFPCIIFLFIYVV